MCGIFGAASRGGRRVGLSDAQAAALRDRLAHRGPDAAGTWRSATGQFLMAHRRLAVVGVREGEGGEQPVVVPDSGGNELAALVYNGELYNDAELREELRSRGVRFRGPCDTETVAAAMQELGVDAIARFRGMFALAWVDLRRNTLLLARDPLGIKPLYYWRDGDGGVVFASEVGAIIAHPAVSASPDLVSVSGYLTTIRTTLGERTLFEGVRTVLPGEVIEFDLGERAVVRSRRIDVRRSEPRDGAGAGPAAAVREVVTDSVARHLRADVPTCSLLSGGLDSSIIVAVCRGLGVQGMRTYASGHDDGGDEGDLAWARRVSAALGTIHTEAPVTREMFADRWREMVDRMCVPLSTPNEVAINEVARRLRADGQVVALSGEGADELFGGYDVPLTRAAEFESTRQPDGRGTFQIGLNAWMPPESKPSVLRKDVWRGVEEDAALIAWYDEEFSRIDASGVQAHLTFQRRVNLAGLLQRLDTATMLEGVEGRTPLADIAVAGLAESLPMAWKFAAGRAGEAPARTKIALREAFAELLPREVVQRPKASFPLPFQDWIADSVEVLRGSGFARTLFTDAAIDAVSQRPRDLWHLAWPMINVALWAERWSDVRPQARVSGMTRRGTTAAGGTACARATGGAR